MTDRKHTAIVIGAGISGLKSCIELSKNGIDTLMLEARDRLGGRLHTVTTESGLKLDLGASWFHDCLYNPLLKKSLEKGNVEIYFDNGKFNVHDKDIGVVDDNYKIRPVVDEMSDYLQYVCAQMAQSDDMSVKNAALRYLRDKKNTLTECQIKLAPQLLRYYEMWIGSSWNMLSARLIASDSHQGRDAMVTNGYRTVYDNELEELYEIMGRRDLVGSQILLQKVVFKIEFDDRTKEIAVHTRDYNGRVETFFCEYLVCSVPLSVLQLQDKKEQGHIEWSPPLPLSLRNKLQGITYSQLGKVFFEFDHVFWPTDVDRFFCIPEFDHEITRCIEANTDTKFENLQQDPVLENSPKPWAHPILFLNVYRGTGRPVLLALTSSPLTRYIESHEIGDFWPVFRPALANIANLPDSCIPRPTNVVTSNWSADPFARGSYLGCAVGDLVDEAIDAFTEAKDVFDGKGRVRFVGEALIDEGNGCAHGAWMTAIRETEKIIKAINRGKL
ncbi:hypothetical protein KL933_003780 [Ogataea haglerorum]|uniref:Amine oxidase domain-containing protein n=1 Tax=Ogataea haglerorum TaxID=1937702 RepID=A0AAN6HZK5_9ASCO|nr:uncharacterized protein KL911_002443 [Ogataea haglerorum]KAG7696652.1 hypothetical protein KL951_003108 [Ogataea haglerorum]KAG7716283.1 hypothetical protein KL913_003494 [Ogataea haglerorum]KAG7717016.1 hypothetical protein KL949_003612 [Ogataea haglerorum]KAG7725732.1 hypothetical protein KL933_003780 [Ogataea haglerorum]KAG7748017.1 hypothetical protein KL912_002694 [Ogataea haglerorum]